MIEKLWNKLFPQKILDGVTSDELTGNEFEYSAVDGVNPDTIPDISKATALGFNQGKYTQTAQACTIVNSIRALMKTASAVYGYNPTTQDVFDAVTYAESVGYVVGSGWMVVKGVDAARNRWNTKHPDMKMNSFIILYDDPDYQKIIQKGYLMVGSYNGSTEYGKDYRVDAVLDGYKFGPRTYGHCTDREWRGEEYVNDSYTGNYYNIYRLKQPKAVIDSGVRSKAYFFYIPAVDNSAEIKRLTQMKAETNNAITANSNAWKLTNDEPYKQFLNQTNDKLRLKLKDIEAELKNL